MDAERIEREIERVRELQRAEQIGAGVLAPEVVHRAIQQALADLQRPLLPRFTDEQLIAIAREAQRKANAGLLPSTVS